MNFQYKPSTEHSPETQLELIEKALKAGCKWVRLCSRDISDNDLRPNAQRAIEAAHDQQGSVLIIEERSALAKELHADGVHLSSPSKVAEVRRAVGEELIIGCDITSLEDAIEAKNGGADYLDCGPYEQFGPEGLRNLIVNLYEADVLLPLSVYGSISTNDIATINGCGARAITTDSLSFFDKDIWAYIQKIS